MNNDKYCPKIDQLLNWNSNFWPHNIFLHHSLTLSLSNFLHSPSHSPPLSLSLSSALSNYFLFSLSLRSSISFLNFSKFKIFFPKKEFWNKVSIMNLHFKNNYSKDKLWCIRSLLEYDSNFICIIFLEILIHWIVCGWA